MEKNSKNKPKKKLSYRAKLALLKSGSILATITPLGIVMFLNRKEYFETTNKVKLSTGLILTLILIILVVFKKMKLQKIVWLAIVFGIAVFFESIFRDIVLLSGALLAGGTVDEIFFVRPIKRFEKLVEYKDQADVQKEAQKDVNKELIEGLAEAIRSGRV